LPFSNLQINLACSSTTGTTLGAVTEPTTCHYEVTLFTPIACDESLFLIGDSPSVVSTASDTISLGGESVAELTAQIESLSGMYCLLACLLSFCLFRLNMFRMHVYIFVLHFPVVLVEIAFILTHETNVFIIFPLPFRCLVVSFPQRQSRACKPASGALPKCSKGTLLLLPETSQGHTTWNFPLNVTNI